MTWERLCELVDWWKRETGGLSDPHRIDSHPAHDEILQGGYDAIPLILRHIRDEGGGMRLTGILHDLTGEWPAKPEDAGYVKRINAAWISWGVERGLIV